jgi:hypothetical protein
VSVLTKVFVLLLSVCSIFLSALVVAAFTQQQNWKASADEWQAAALAAQSKERAAVGSAVIEKQRGLDLHKRDAAKIADLKDKLAQADTRTSELERQLADSQNKLAVEQGQVTSVADQGRLIQTALNSEKQFSAKMASRNSELERGNIDLTDRVKELTVQVESARTQIRALTQQLAHVDRVGSVGQVPGGEGIVEAGVPSVEPLTSPALATPIRGEVTSVDGARAQISVGSADGVTPGMNFLIYRRGSGSRPQYLGNLKVTVVDSNNAAGEIEQSEGDIRSGDSVRDEASFAMRG